MVSAHITNQNWRLVKTAEKAYQPSMQMMLFIRGLSTFETLVQLGKAVEEGCPKRTVVTLNIHTPFGHEQVPINAEGVDAARSEAWKSKVAYFETRAWLVSEPLSIQIHQDWTITFSVEGNPKQPTLKINVSESHRNPIEELELLDALSKHFTVIPESQIAAAALADTQLAGLRFAEQTIGTFASEAAKLSQSTSRNFEEFVAGVKQRTLELEAQFQTKSKELDDHYLKRNEELAQAHTNKLKELEEREKTHAEAVKQFELRNNTAVRRDLLKEIKAKIEAQKSIDVSDSTVQKRRIIHAVCVITLAAAGLLAGLFAQKLYVAQSFDWRMILPMSTGALVFVMTGVFYIRWNDQWFREHARVEFENRKFSSDILRASWIAELFFEWAEKKGVNMPPELVASFTKNLFDTSNLDGRLHPADQLNDLIKQFSKIKVSKGGLEMSRKEPKPANDNQ